MAQARVFSLIGDSNVRNHVNKNSCRANPSLKSAQVMSCGNISVLVPTLEKVRQTSTVCIIACVTNFLCDADGPVSIQNRIGPILQDFRAALAAACEAHTDRWYVLSPPMYRSYPVWYREGLPEILALFSQAFSTSGDRPQNLLLLPSFPTPEYDADGVHLTAYSGLEYIMHLFDHAEDVISSAALPVEEVTHKTCESTRVLEDRVMVLEQDHRRLSRVVEHKTAVDSELADFRANERTEDFFVIAGLPRIADDLTGKDWQDQAVKDVKAVLVILMGRDMPIVFVRNGTFRHEGAEVTYNVQMASVADSSAVRTKFGSFFLGGRKEKPAALASISIKNFVTPETRIRISLLKLIAQKYRDSNPRAKVQVIGYQPRPVIKITPAPSSADRRVRAYNFVEAVKVLPCNFSSAELEPIVRRINTRLLGQVRSIFVILSDDQFRKHLSKFRGAAARGPGAPAQDGATEADTISTNAEAAGDDNAIDSVNSVVLDQPPAPAAIPLPSGSGSGSRSSIKRGATSPAGAVPAKK